jgi:chemotaxis signal transduction protein
MDSVIAESIPMSAIVLKEKLGLSFTKTDVNDWDWVQHHFDLTTAQIVDAFAEVWGKRWNEIQPTESDMEKKVEKLNELADVTIVTSASPEQASGKIQWLYKYGLKQIPILFVPYGKTKEALPYHIFVDDRDDTIEKVTKAGKIGILYDQPWNQKCKVGFRVKSLSNVISFFEGKGI